MKTLLAMGFSTVLLAGCNLGNILDQGPRVTGSGKLKSETRKVGRFTKIESRGSADCKVSVGKSASVSVSADDNILPLITTTVEDGVLVVSCKGSFSTKNPIVVTISTQSLERFSIEGSGDAEITGIRGASFAGSISGSGSIRASGEVDRLAASIAGSGDLALSRLRARDATASISGSGGIELHATGTLLAAIQGSGDIAYLGNPQVQKSISGSGSVHAK